MTIDECIKAWHEFNIPGPRSHPCLFFDQAEIDEIVRLSLVKGTRQQLERQKVDSGFAEQYYFGRDINGD